MANYKFIDKLMSYLRFSVEMNPRGDAYQRLLNSLILSLCPVSTDVETQVRGFVRSAQKRILDDDAYNARILIESAVKSVEIGDIND